MDERNVSTAVLGNEVNLTGDELNDGCHLGLDNHAGTTCAGKHVRVIEYVDGKLCDVYPFNDSYDPMSDIGVINGELQLTLLMVKHSLLK